MPIGFPLLQVLQLIRDICIYLVTIHQTIGPNRYQYRIVPTSNPEQWFFIPRVNILHPKSRGRSPRDEGMQYVHPRDDAKTIALGLMSEQSYNASFKAIYNNHQFQ